MRLVILFLLAGVTIQGYSQKKSKVRFELYKQGRPASFEYNNASRAVETRWNIYYLSGNNTGVAGPSTNKISSNNKKTSKLIAAHYGDDWLQRFQKEVGEEMAKQNEIRKLVKEDPYFKSLKAEELFIVLDPKCKKAKKYIVKVVAQQLQGDKRPFMIYCRYKYKVSSRNLKLVCKKIVPLDFSYVENGIE